jgi:AcrR family transcriptional regulator
VPTGVAIRDVREQLFDAAERVLLRDGPAALTSRAVTDEAGVAKGVLHRTSPTSRSSSPSSPSTGSRG